MKRPVPTRIVQTGRLARGLSGQPTGWLQDLAERARNLKAQLVGINERLNTPLRDGVPACVDGEMTFLADTTRTITIANFAQTPDRTAGAGFIALNVNPIIRAGQTYRVPITFPPPGVFEAHHLSVGIEAGFTMFAGAAISGITPLNDYRQTQFVQFVNRPDTHSMKWTNQQQVLGFSTLCDVLPMLPFLWNIVDEKSGRQYAKSWMPHGALLNPRGNAMSSVSRHTPDGELFEFDKPWLFERDGQVAFMFRPIMDLFQVDSGSATLPYSTDDRTAGRRQQQATLKVEFHGNRYYTAQDVLKDGARV